MNTVGPNFNQPISRNMLAASLALHLGIILALTMRALVFPSDIPDYESAVKVDIVALPDKFKQLPSPAEQIEENVPVPVKPEEAVPVKVPPKKEKVNLTQDKKKAQQKEALEKIKALQELDNIKEEVKQGEEQKRKKSQQVKGNILSKGNALRGIVSSQLAGYAGDLERHAKDHWSLPQWMAQDTSLKARAIVYLDERGFVVKRVLTLSSGNPTFDELVIRAIDSASPFPAPPSALVDLVKVRGIQLGFPE